MATLSGPYQTANFQLVSPNGTVLQAMNLATGSAEAPQDALTGSVTLPTAAFQVRVTGVDSNGLTYQRYIPQLFQPQAVSVASGATSSILAAGATTVVPFFITNGSSSQTYQLSASSSQGFTTTVSPSTVTLDVNASATVSASVTVPASAMQGEKNSVTLTATSTTNAALANGATAPFTIDKELSQTMLSFPGQFVGATSGSQSFTVTNGTAGTLAISQIVASPEFNQTNNCGTSVAGGSSCTVQVTFSPLAPGTRMGTVVVADSTLLSPRIVSLTGGATDFSIASSGSNSATVSAGQPAVYTINFNIQGSPLPADVMLACSGLPTASSCSFNPAVVPAGSASVTTTLTINTTARGNIVQGPKPPEPNPNPMFMALWAASVLAAMMIGLGLRGARPRFAGFFIVVSFLVLSSWMAGCGGDSNGSGAGGTPAGTSNVTVTASAGSFARTTSVTLTVR